MTDTQVDTKLRTYVPLPELDSSRPDNDLGPMVSWLIIINSAIGLLLWWAK